MTQPPSPSKMELLLGSSWQNVLQEEWCKPYFLQLIDFLIQERASPVPIYPPPQEVFSAFALTPFDQVKVVIMGQDPYHGPKQAHGLSFSVCPGNPLPPSLRNIFQELHTDLGISPPSHGSLISWAKQGVLMLNAVLTVRAHQPRSHQKKGWEQFTDTVITHLATREDPPIFVLWGHDAKAKCRLILEKVPPIHFILESMHPSPYSAHFGFFGCRHFSKINEHLKSQGKAPIDWVIK